MSANNMQFAKEIDGKWYGWDIMAEAWGDHGIDNPVKLSLENATTADSIMELEEKLNEDSILTAEYGITTQPYLIKDGTPIEVV